ncbi:Os07g0294201 [Oryza sativa Japonica Group]|uniref:Os07g0294201 protein n=1 Tax=Oryza sativa subsp. japonica TaxID=39947 RepID=A0A0P0X4V2_ORYSJ|nr:Os07g0294201 [Oryza sativa Japonica Group]
MEERGADVSNTCRDSFGRSTTTVGITAVGIRLCRPVLSGGAWYQQGSGRAGTEGIGGTLGRASARSVASCQSSRAGVKDGGIPDVGQREAAAVGLVALGIGAASVGGGARRGQRRSRQGLGRRGVSISGLVGVVMPLRRRGQREGETGGIGSVSMGGGFGSVTAGCELSA